MAASTHSTFGFNKTFFHFEAFPGVGGGLDFTRYCQHQYCMVYGIQKGGRWLGVYCATVVQSYCNGVGFASGGGVTG